MTAASSARRLAPPTPRELSRELRLARSPDLRRRRAIVGLSQFGAVMAEIVSLYQMGLISRLPDLPSRRFDATKVDKSDYAYSRLRTPDGLLMLVSYALTAWLAGARGRRRVARTPWLPLAMAAKAAYDVVTTARLAREEWRENRALCGFCTAASLASVGIALLSLPEARRAAGEIRRDLTAE